MSFSHHHITAQIPAVHTQRRVLAPADQRPHSSQHLDQNEHKAPKQQLPQPSQISSTSVGGNYVCHWVGCGIGIETPELLYVRQTTRLIPPFLDTTVPRD